LLFGISPACSNSESPANTIAERPAGPADRVELVMFHFTSRCYSCNYAEAGIEYTLENYFKEDYDSGRITFTAYNIEDLKNTATAKKYNAYGLSIYINTIIDDQEFIEGLYDVWLCVGRDEEFIAALEKHISAALTGEG